MKSTGVFAPARLSSERLPQKHLLPIGDSCIFDICCRKMEELAVRGIPSYVLICEDELFSIARRYPHITIVERNPETADADGPANFIYKDIAAESQETHLMFLNPCLIFLKVDTVVRTVETFNSMANDYGTSIKRFQNWVLNERMEPLCHMDCARLSTKEIEPLYEIANAFHLFNRENFIKDGMVLKDGFHGFLIEDSAECVDIDTRDDFEFAKWKYEHGGAW